MGRSITIEYVVNRLAEFFAMYGVPVCIRSDNSSAFVAKAIQQWLSLLEINTLYVEPASPWQNESTESFHSRLRDELLNMEEFEQCTARTRPRGNLVGVLKGLSTTQLFSRPVSG